MAEGVVLAGRAEVVAAVVELLADGAGRQVRVLHADHRHHAVGQRGREAGAADGGVAPAAVGAQDVHARRHDVDRGAGVGEPGGVVVAVGGADDDGVDPVPAAHGHAGVAGGPQQDAVGGVAVVAAGLDRVAVDAGVADADRAGAVVGGPARALREIAHVGAAVAAVGGADRHQADVPGHPGHALAVVADGADAAGHPGAVAVDVGDVAALRLAEAGDRVVARHQRRGQVLVALLDAGVDEGGDVGRVPGAHVPAGRAGHDRVVPLLVVLRVVGHLVRVAPPVGLDVLVVAAGPQHLGEGLLVEALRHQQNVLVDLREAGDADVGLEPRQGAGVAGLCGGRAQAGGDQGLHLQRTDHHPAGELHLARALAEALAGAELGMDRGGEDRQQQRDQDTGMHGRVSLVGTREL